MGQFGHLKRRLTMLKQGNVARALTWTGFTAACGAGALLLSIAPTFAQSVSVQSTSEKHETAGATPAVETTAAVVVQERSESTQSQKSEPPAPGVAPVGVAPAAPETVGLTPPAPPDSLLPADDAAPASPAPGGSPKAENPDNNFRGEMAREEASRARQAAAAQRRQGELDRARKEVAELSRRLQQAAGRLQQLEMAAAQGEIDKATQDLSKAQAKIGVDWQNQIQFDFRPGKVTMIPPKGDPRIVSPNLPDGASYSITRRPLARPSSDSDRERRLDAVERQLSQLLNEVKRLRTDGEDAPPAPTPEPAKR
jgi:hypothetical protein